MQNWKGLILLKKYDMVVIGSGAALIVMEEALAKGKTCAVIEKAKFGGTCLTKGCIPSKTLVYPADFIREAEHARKFGVTTAAPVIDWELISGRVWEQINLSKKLQQNLEETPNLTVYHGKGTFTSPTEMIVRYDDGRPDDRISGDKFVIGAGARTLVPDIPGLETAGYLTSERFFGAGFPAKPWDSLVIVGGGAISTEFAHIFSAFGTKVTLILRSEKILKKEEEEVADFVTKQFENNGIRIINNSAITEAGKDENGKYLITENRLTGENVKVQCEEILIASGVRTNGDTLDLDKAGVETDKRGWIVTNAYLETSQPHIWAIGDINGKYQFRHKANYEAQIVADNLYSGEPKKPASYDSVPWAVFTHPQVAHVGMTEAIAKEKGLTYKIAKKQYASVAAGRAMGYRKGDDDDGFVKMIIGENKKILGAHIVGPHAAILLQPFVYLMNAGYCCKIDSESNDSSQIELLRSLCPYPGSYAPINGSMIIHPSLNELTAWVFQNLD